VLLVDVLPAVPELDEPEAERPLLSLAPDFDPEPELDPEPDREPEPEPPSLAIARLAPRVMVAVSTQVMSAAAVTVPSRVEILEVAMDVLR
jgi:hypothetical protein